MKPSDVQTALQRNGLAPLYLVVGEEDYLRDQVIGMIRAHALQSEKGTDTISPFFSRVKLYQLGHLR